MRKQPQTNNHLAFTRSTKYSDDESGKYPLPRYPLDVDEIRAVYNAYNTNGKKAKLEGKSPQYRATTKPKEKPKHSRSPASFSVRGWRVLSRVVSMNKNLRSRVASRLTPILKLPTLEPRGPTRRSPSAAPFLSSLPRRYFIPRPSIARKSHGSQSAVAETRTYFRPSAHSPRETHPHPVARPWLHELSSAENKTVSPGDHYTAP